METWKKKAKIITSILIFFCTIYLATHKGIQKLKTLARIETEISIDYLLERNKNGQIMEMISTRC